MPEGSVLYAHVVAVDANGNQTANSQGPFYFDAAATPYFIAELAREDWVPSGGKQVGQMSTPTRGVQKLFAGWDATHLRLRWEGFNVDSEGDLYFYLGTGGGGTTDLFNPSGPVQGVVLPFTANYLVRVAAASPDALQRRRRRRGAPDRGSCADQRRADRCAAALRGSRHRQPGSDQPQAARRRCGAGDAGCLGHGPRPEPGADLGPVYRMESLGAGIVPAAGVWADAPIEVIRVTAEPSPAQLVGVGDAIAVR